ncbi:MAG: hypothetical protein L3J24_02395 [Xanthomonadales bacterium]|nr:hypothetical protein [Xanthomonadales bacterium]
MLITLAVLIMLLGPLLYLRAQKIPGWAHKLERGLIILLLVMVAFVLLPEVYREVGVAGLALVVVGIGLPSLLEHSLHRLAHTTHIITLVIATAGLAFHSMLDGAALSQALAQSANTGNTFVMAVLLHRLLAGMVIWLILQPVSGNRLAFIMILIVAVSALPGYFLAPQLLGMHEGQASALFQALVVGTIIHGLMHRSQKHQHSH